MNNDASELLSARLWRWWQTQQQLKVAEAHGTQQAERAEKADQRIADLERQLADTTWQDHADHWQKRALKAERQLAEAQKDVERIDWIDNNVTAIRDLGWFPGSNWPRNNLRRCIDAAIDRSATAPE